MSDAILDFDSMVKAESQNRNESIICDCEGDHWNWNDGSCCDGLAIWFVGLVSGTSLQS